MSKQITWIKKSDGNYNPDTHITEVGGTDWSRLVDDAVLDIKADAYAFNVSTGAGTAWVSYGIRNGRYYLHTVPDETPLDNLLSLTNTAA